MAQINDFGTAVLFIATGLILFLVVFLMLKMAPRLRSGAQRAVSLGGAALVADHTDAVMVVEAGGRVRSINPRARQIFRLQEGELPNLERLARKVRPSEALIKLCAAEGQVRFVLDGRLIEGTSYLVTTANLATSVISLRYPEIASGLVGGQGNINAQTLQTFTQLTQEMATSLNLDKTLQTVLENIEKLMPADFMEVTIWDAESEFFVPYRFVGLLGVDRKLELARERYRVDQGLSGHLYKERKPLLVSEVETRPDLVREVESTSTPMRSFIWRPFDGGQ